MAWKRGERIPTNFIVGFLGSGKTTCIAKLIEQRPAGEDWSIFVNEFGEVAIDHALVDSSLDGISVEKLGGGCACCTLSMAFRPLLAQFIRRTKPDRLILEPSGMSHPAKVVDILRGEGFGDAIDLRNIICLVDPKDFEDPRWQDSEVYQDQIQLADIVVLNWTDVRDRELVDRCRNWINQFRPPKQLVIESSFGAIDLEILDLKFETVRLPLFDDAHPLPPSSSDELVVLQESSPIQIGEKPTGKVTTKGLTVSGPTSGQPLRYENNDSDFSACGWVFHVDDVFDRNQLLDLLGGLHPILRLKGIFRCSRQWWTINRAKEGTNFVPSTWRRDSRLEVIIETRDFDWLSFEQKLLNCKT